MENGDSPFMRWNFAGSEQSLSVMPLLATAAVSAETTCRIVVMLS